MWRGSASHRTEVCLSHGTDGVTGTPDKDSHGSSSFSNVQKGLRKAWTSLLCGSNNKATSRKYVQPSPRGARFDPALHHPMTVTHRSAARMVSVTVDIHRNLGRIALGRPGMLLEVFPRPLYQIPLDTLVRDDRFQFILKLSGFMSCHEDDAR